MEKGHRAPKYSADQLRGAIEKWVETGSQAEAAGTLGGTRNVLSGLVDRAGGLENLIAKVGIKDAKKIASDIHANTKARMRGRGKSGFNGQAVPPTSKEDRKSRRSRIASSKNYARTVRNTEAMRLVTRAETLLNRKKDTRELEASLDRIARAIIVNDPNIPGVMVIRGRAAVRKNGEALTETTPTEEFVQIQLSRTEDALGFSALNESLIALMCRDLDSEHSILKGAAKQVNVKRIAVVVQQTIASYLPIIDCVVN